MPTKGEETSINPERRTRNWALRSKPIQRTDSAPITTSSTLLKKNSISYQSSIRNASVSNSPTISKENTLITSTNLRNSKNNTINYNQLEENGQKRESEYRCPFCNLCFISEYTINKHINEQHPDFSPKIKKEGNKSIFDSDSEEDVLGEAINWIKQKHQTIIKPIQKQTPNLQQIQKLVRGDHPDIVFDKHLKRENSVQSNSNMGNETTIKTSHYKNINQAKNCFDKNCNKTLGLLSGKVNCKRCGEVYCEEHSDFSMKLDNNAIHDPINGLWYKVCFSCYKSKANYKNEQIITRDLTLNFKTIRRKVVDKLQLETNRLDTRLKKLALIQYNNNNNNNNVNINNINNNGFGSIKKNANRLAEQAIVPWQPDEEANNCPYCLRVFNRITLRKHHCRLCGKVICNNIKCSSKINLSSLIEKVNINSINKLEILCCQECRKIVLKKQEALDFKKEDLTLIRNYNQLKRYQTIIQKSLPKFNSLIYSIKSKSSFNEQDNEVQSALIMRKELLTAFSQFETSLQSFKRIPTNNHLQQRLCQGVITEAIQFLQANTVSLSMLPKLLNQNQNKLIATPTSKIDVISLNTETNLDLLNNNLNPDLFVLRQQLDVFQEQKFNLIAFIEAATRERRLDDVRNLSLNLKELEDEIQLLKNKIK